MSVRLIHVLGLICIGLGLVIIGAVFVSYIDFEEIVGISKEELRSSEYWGVRIQRIGGKKAYEEFATAVAKDGVSFQHEAAHTFGEALYSQEGMDGISVCDARFSYGCFHEFLGRAIFDKGINTVSLLNDTCIAQQDHDKTLTCQHGIGHGVLAYYGYDKNALSRALRQCKELPMTDKVGGCYGGVFMEYNFQTMLADDGVGRSPGNDMFAPCSELSEDYLPACVFWQPQWWLFLSAPWVYAKAEDFSLVGDYCRDFVKDPALHHLCFRGIGNMAAPVSQYNEEIAKTYCEAASISPEEKMACEAVAVPYARNAVLRQ